MNYLLCIKEHRISKKMTQRQLAIKCRLNQSYISQLENNHPRTKSPTLIVIFRIARALEICPHMLVQYNISCNNNCLSKCEKKPFTF